MKIELSDVAGGYNLQVINENFDKVAAALNDKVLYRDNPVGEPNALQTGLDANGKAIYNLPAPGLANQAARLQDVQNAISNIATANLTLYEPLPAGNLSATNVQGAITELDAEKVSAAELSNINGAGLVGHQGSTVAQRLDRIIGYPSPGAAPMFGYSGVKHYSPLLAPFSQLPNYSAIAPVRIDMNFSDETTPPATGVAFAFGPPGLVSGAGWTQDGYEIRNLTVTGGTPQVMTFEPWTGLTATVENVRIMQNGSPTAWAINFKQQNWWPLVRGNVFADHTDKRGNFCKAIDDEGPIAHRYSGNSRVVFNENRCKWLGLSIGGIGFYGSAVANKLRDNAFEGSSVGAVLGAPSLFTTIDGFYNEMPFGNQIAVSLGDFATAPNNTISLVGIHDLFVNMHQFTNNRIISVSNASVLVNGLSLDRVLVTNIPANPPPMVALNDLAGQKVSAGIITADDMPLIPLLNNYVSVKDLYNCAIPTLNGDMVFADVDTVAIPVNVSTAIARNWFARSTVASSVTRSQAGVNRRSLRQARNLGTFAFGANSTNSIFYQLPRANQFEGDSVTVQFLLNSTLSLTHTVSLRIYNPDGTRPLLRSKTVSSVAAWGEHTMTCYVDPASNSEDSLLVLEVSHSSVAASNVFMTGVRFNKGSFGLSGRADMFSYTETQSKLTGLNWITP